MLYSCLLFFLFLDKKNKYRKGRDGDIVTSLTLLTLPVVAKFIGCGEKTIRRALLASVVVKGTWIVKVLGKLNP